jgi:DNA processing protein
MEPARLRAMLARTPGLLAAHLFACLSDDPSPDVLVPAQLLARLLTSHLPGRARAWLEHPHTGLIDADLRWSQADDCRILLCVDADFPAALARWAAAPAALYVCGRGSPGAATLAIVGARQATAGGLDTARVFAGELARAGLSIGSGLAEGIGAAAHEGAMAAGGHTIAVCATGVDRIYPTCHARLAARIRACGTLISMFPPGTPARRHHFPLRNRLLGALSAGTLVVEAAPGSGALTTVHQTRLLQKPVFAIPGSIRDPLARGGNQLIRAGARLVQESCEILQDLGINFNNQHATGSPAPALQPRSGPSPLDNKYEMLLDAAGFEPVDIDVLAFRTGWSGHTVASMLLLLELQGRVAPQPGGWYCRLS